MNDYTKLLASVSALINEMRALQAIAVAEYGPEVESLIATESHDTRRIERTLDGLLEFCGDERALDLFRRLCRHYFAIDPLATASYIHAYREWWDSAEEQK